MRFVFRVNPQKVFKIFPWFEIPSAKNHLQENTYQPAMYWSQVSEGVC